MAAVPCAFQKLEGPLGCHPSANRLSSCSIALQTCYTPRSRTSFDLLPKGSNACPVADGRTKTWGLGRCHLDCGKQVARRRELSKGRRKGENGELEHEERRTDGEQRGETNGVTGQDEDDEESKERKRNEQLRKSVSEGRDEDETARGSGLKGREGPGAGSGHHIEKKKVEVESDARKVEIRHIRKEKGPGKNPGAKGYEERVGRRDSVTHAPAVPSVKHKKNLREARLQIPSSSATRGAGSNVKGKTLRLESVKPPSNSRTVEESGEGKQSKPEGRQQEVGLLLPVATKRSVVALVRGEAKSASALIMQTKSELTVARFKAPGTSVVLHSAVSLVNRDARCSSAPMSTSETDPTEPGRADSLKTGLNNSRTGNWSEERSNWVKAEQNEEVGPEETQAPERSREPEVTMLREENQMQTQAKVLNAPKVMELFQGAQSSTEETRKAGEDDETTGNRHVPLHAQLSGSELGQTWREAVTPSSKDDSALHEASKTGVLDLEPETQTDGVLPESDLEGGIEAAGTGNDDREAENNAFVEATERESNASAASPQRVSREEENGSTANAEIDGGLVRKEEPHREMKGEGEEKGANPSGQPSIRQPAPAEARARATESALTSETLKHDARALHLLTSLLAQLHLAPLVLPQPDAPPQKAEGVPKSGAGIETALEESFDEKEVIASGSEVSRGENGSVDGSHREGSENLGFETRGDLEALREESLAGRAVIKVIGIGGGGCNAVDRMVQDGVGGVTFWAINTDAQQLRLSHAEHKMQIGRSITHGKGSGGNTRLAELASEEHHKQLEDAVKGADLVFIAAGLGGGVGTGIAPIVGKLAKATGALTIGTVTEPFAFEGAKRAKIVRTGIEALRAAVDALVVVPNDRLLDLITDKTPIEEAFRMADAVLRQGFQGISDIITTRGLVNVDLADVRAIMKDAGDVILGIGEGSGPDRARAAATRALGSPLQSLEGKGVPTGVIYNLTSGRDLTLREMTTVAEIVAGHVHPAADIIVGTVIDEKFRGELHMTIILTRFLDEPGEGVANDARTAYNGLYADSDALWDSSPCTLEDGPYRRSTPRGTGTGTRHSPHRR
ncbi:plastid division protein FtsZ [Klebsormidium nitens]|uniref:Plastid division protein FtsZ n=1 Tax=Klebsormidium nitens TaxID=105231 RepID=A0A1Y1I2W0_KLENI|nr:plastid division protein FtsZ [Klebsormidium nitens]|eukprot:GAQ83521.1 plastid division protein FtsZ [Klebsormidium nitens]